MLFILFYNIFVYPLIWAGAHLLALFNRKARKGVVGRYRSLKAVRQYLALFPDIKERYLVHCASMGEFEHIKIFLRELKRLRPDSHTVVMFFSPSGYENVREEEGIDLFIYTPFDGWIAMKRLFGLLSPRALFIAKYDLWPNQIWTAHRRKVPAFLINATLSPKSSRLRPGIRELQRLLYRRLTGILAVAETDRRNYEALAPRHLISVVGDTKYDQVLYRSETAARTSLIPSAFYAGHQVFLAGSTWPEDQVHLLPAAAEMLERFPELRLIVCPHEPTPEHLEDLTRKLAAFPTIRYSELASYRNHRVIVIDKIGILAHLYSVAQIAYVGGSFRQNVHNVVEPAAYGIPVLFGPVNQNSHEAQHLKSAGGGFEVHNREQIEAHLRAFLEDGDFRRTAGLKAREVVRLHSGATTRLLEDVFQVLRKLRRS
ncbi:MAG: hypothetical protein KDI06_10710 [Calditrichaeota bacterium]|nr:hypothetical protein [Calditrichota bacterium]